ncbi:MAG: N-methyl-L-tryptophan oxidase [Anaerolineaceae bacterium]|nr:N-methyl-L-tryptophan oxidase [Anaerolineaceae bacterium]MDE0328143.1 N-methyl-L-tryptophan oxidase [Anaerolineaceae bacterium]
MNSKPWDVIVLGVGGMGSAALYHLARRGQRVLGLEQFDLAHEMGSSHGLTRIIRLAYYEDPAYVPLLRRSYELWRELERDSGEHLLHICGSLDIGPPDNEVFAGSLQSCLEHDLSHEALTGAEINARWPACRFPAETMGLYQPEGGFLLPEAGIRAFVQVACEQGATLRTGQRVLNWQVNADGLLQVSTETETHLAQRLVITAGAWAGKLLPRLGSVALPERQVLAWMQPLDPPNFTPERFPVFNCLVDEGRYYGFPDFAGQGFKIGRYHHLEEAADPDTLDRDCVRDEDRRILRDFAECYFRGGAGPDLLHKVCMFTNTPDEHFIIDRHPEYEQVHFAAGFSGHGYKFASVIGEILADLALKDTTRHDIAFLRSDREMIPLS